MTAIELNFLQLEIFRAIYGLKCHCKAVKALKAAGTKNFLFALNALADECYAFYLRVQEINKKAQADEH